ncbi:phosphoribosyltransferase [Pusillimonas sp. TS35]|uniref:phosphoribosyltransferase n=1 Tax=Paracandidimonas lactea TaxID=2895524 RepID=UPI00136D0C52|nr:phosphoribosyltransferase family protein [Paracandidimonas lactea]MYN12127.1 phosphoribosyltransferase [Pusillimonas sp. TS35]
MKPLYHDRRDAGRALGEALRPNYGQQPNVLVLGLPRGGVPVAAEVARLLDAPLDVLLVRKLGVPGDKEFAMGAIATGDVCVVDEQVTRLMGIGAQTLERVRTMEQRELERRELAYRAGRPPLDLQGRTVILVDDGLATGATMRAAIVAARKLGAVRVVVAAPVGSADAREDLAGRADDMVCLACPAQFRAVGLWYDRFTQTTDREVEQILTGRG